MFFSEKFLAGMRLVLEIYFVAWFLYWLVLKLFDRKRGISWISKRSRLVPTLALDCWFVGVQFRIDDVLSHVYFGLVPFVGFTLFIYPEVFSNERSVKRK